MTHTDKDGVHTITHDSGLEVKEDPNADHYQLDAETVNVGRDTVDYVALAQKVLDELIKVQTDLATLKSAITAGLGASAAGIPAAGSALAVSTFNTASATVPHTPASVASPKVRTA